jgi:hypothetical protein
MLPQIQGTEVYFCRHTASIPIQIREFSRNTATAQLVSPAAQTANFPSPSSLLRIYLAYNLHHSTLSGNLLSVPLLTANVLSHSTAPPPPQATQFTHKKTIQLLPTPTRHSNKRPTAGNVCIRDPDNTFAFSILFCT